MAKLLRVTAAATLTVALAAVSPGMRSSKRARPRDSRSPSHLRASGADGQPIFRTGINFVRVDVIVTDKNGNPSAT
jgi:hypothetical protein